MERVLLQETDSDYLCDLQDQLLVVGKHIAADQLDDLHQAALLCQQEDEAVSVIDKFLVHMFHIPWG